MILKAPVKRTYSSSEDSDKDKECNLEQLPEWLTNKKVPVIPSCGSGGEQIVVTNLDGKKKENTEEEKKVDNSMLMVFDKKAAKKRKKFRQKIGGQTMQDPAPDQLGDSVSESGSNNSKNSHGVSSYGKKIAKRAPQIDIANVDQTIKSSNSSKGSINSKGSSKSAAKIREIMKKKLKSGQKSKSSEDNAIK